MKKIIIRISAIIALLLVSSLSLANGSSGNKVLLNSLQTFNGKPIIQNKSKLTHLVFIDVWRSYEGKGDEKMIAALPDDFLSQSQQIWIQPEINVTKAQLAEFQQYFAEVKPLVMDKKFALMRGFSVWQSPFHVLIEKNKTIFSGDAAALSAFINKKYNLANVEEKLDTVKPTDIVNNSGDIHLAENSLVTNITNITDITKATKPHKPLVGDIAPKFSAKTLTGKNITLESALSGLTDNKPLNLVFLDALCPMPHFPGCEEKIALLNQLIKADSSRQWLAVVNSYYVNEDFAKDFVKKFALKLPILFDNDNTIYRGYDVYASPYQIKVNRQGFIESRSALLN